jgi:hypothetical protein
MLLTGGVDVDGDGDMRSVSSQNSTINESNHMRCRLRNINNESSTDDPGRQALIPREQ